MRRGALFRRSQKTATMNVRLKASPMTGATTMKIRVLYHPVAMITCHPDRMTAAPAYPPIKACEEEVGSPHHQVSRSQTIAPKSPVITTYWVTLSTWIMPPPMVLATAVPRRNAATKLKNAARNTASLGHKTRVETLHWMTRDGGRIHHRNHRKRDSLREADQSFSAFPRGDRDYTDAG